MDIFTAIKEDHQKVSALFEKIEQTSEKAVKTKQKLFDQIKEELTKHTQAEEKVVYKQMQTEEEGLTEEAEEEHEKVKQLLKEIGRNKKFDEEWHAQLQELKENVEHHVQMEETEYFDRMREAISEDELDEMVERFQKAKGSTGNAKKKSAGKKKAAARR